MNTKQLQTTLKEAFAAERIEAPDYLLTVLISGVASVLVTRVYLELTGYPVIGAGGIHIAHVFFGGMFMLGSGIINLSFHGKHVRFISAALLGVGFGQFIDEAGKFLTHDNNYFFQPTTIIIYVSFLGIFYLYQKIKQKEAKTSKALLYQALEQIEEIIETNFEKAEKQAVISTLNKVINHHHSTYSPFAIHLKSAINKQTATPNQTNPFIRTYKIIRSKLYQNTFKKRYFVPFLFSIFLIHGISSTSTIFYTFFRYKNLDSLQQFLETGTVPTNLNLTVFLFQTITEIISVAFVILGLISLRLNRLKALTYFSRALIIKILFTHIFSFYFEQFSATIGAFIDIALLIGISRLIFEEKLRTRSKQAYL